MKVVLLAVIAAACVVQSARADTVADTLSAKAADCIKTEAPRVSALSQSLTDTVNFLVDDLCIIEIKHAVTYDTNSRTLADWRATAAGSQLTGISIDPVTGELNTPPGFSPPFNASSMMLNALRSGLTQEDQFRSVAAKAVLAARTTAAVH